MAESKRKAFPEMTTVRISRESLAALQRQRVLHAQITGTQVSLSATIAVILGLPVEPSRRVSLKPPTIRDMRD